MKLSTHKQVLSERKLKGNSVQGYFEDVAQLKTTASLKRLLLLKTSRTIKSTITQRDGPDSQNSKPLFAEITVMFVQIRSVLLSYESPPLCFDEVF